MNIEVIWQFLTTQGADFGLKVVGAIAAWIVGRWLIGLALRLMAKAFQRGGKIDPTLSNYLTSIISVVLNIILSFAILCDRQKAAVDAFTIRLGDHRVRVLCDTDTGNIRPSHGHRIGIGVIQNSLAVRHPTKKQRFIKGWKIFSFGTFKPPFQIVAHHPFSIQASHSYCDFFLFVWREAKTEL